VAEPIFLNPRPRLRPTGSATASGDGFPVKLPAALAIGD
jgi:hypothetical protein